MITCSRAYSRIRNLIAVATGLGLTKNIIDCYAAILQMWQPGDKIFLFGFSRGAYTVRCLGGVIAYCGIPTKAVDFDAPIKRDLVSTRRISVEAVKGVYQHTSSRKTAGATPRQLELLDQRKVLAEEFRRKYGSDDAGIANVAPYFIGVFDTVASLANPVAVLAFAAIAVVALLLLSLGLAFGTHNFGWSATIVFIAAALTVGVSYLATHLRFPGSIPGYPWYRTAHLTEFRVRFYDTDLSPRVAFARHAISIDERRKAFPRVPWGLPSVLRTKAADSPEWFEQYWFAGNHADIGGGYDETNRDCQISHYSGCSTLPSAPGSRLTSRSCSSIRTLPRCNTIR